MTLKLQVCLLLVAAAYSYALTDMEEVEEREAMTVYTWGRRLGSVLRLEYAKWTSTSNYIILESAVPEGEPVASRDKSYYGFRDSARTKGLVFYTLGAGFKCFAMTSPYTKQEVIDMATNMRGKIYTSPAPIILDGRKTPVPAETEMSMITNYPFIGQICTNGIIMVDKASQMPADTWYAKINSGLGRVHVLVNARG